MEHPISFPFRIIPDAEGHPLRDPLAVWLTERYGPEITAAAGWVNKRVEFLVARNDPKLAAHNGKTGKVTAAALLLNDDHLFRYTVVLDKGGATVEGATDGDFFFSALSDAEAGLSAGSGGTLTVTDPKTGRPETVPLTAWEVQPSRRPVARKDHPEVGRRVRVMQATRHPSTFMAEGFVSRVLEANALRPKQYGVRLNDGRYFVYYATEVRLL